MRMRKRANLDARMERCAALLIGEPEKLRGQWQAKLPGHERLYLELGCGKGRFTADTAETMPETLYIALEKVPDAMILAMEKIDRRGIGNVRFIDADAKLRLTSPAFLRRYADILADGGEIHFKTDNTPLFDWSIAQLEAEGWRLSEVTHDLHANGPVGVMTDYEARFYEQGMKINRLVATKTGDTKGTAAGEVPRLRNASLTDARGYEESLEANRRNEG